MEVSTEEFERLVGDALDGIPETLGRLMDNVAVFVEHRATPAQLDGQEARSSGCTAASTSPVVPPRRGHAGPHNDFRGPICRLARSEAELVQLVRHTVVHEVAHHFGISDRRLEELGFEPGHHGHRG